MFVWIGELCNAVTANEIKKYLIHVLYSIIIIITVYSQKQLSINRASKPLILVCVCIYVVFFTDELLFIYCWLKQTTQILCFSIN
jgi:hypothetical protein